jgi:hypothetical protein
MLHWPIKIPFFQAQNDDWNIADEGSSGSFFDSLTLCLIFELL